MWLTNRTPATLVWSQTELDDTKSCYKLITTITISEKKKTNAFFFCERAFKTNYPKLEKISQAETLSNVMNSTILKNPQIGRVTGRCYGYFDKFWDWWTSLSTHLKYDWLIMMKLSDYSQLSDYCPITTLHND